MTYLEVDTEIFLFIDEALNQQISCQRIRFNVLQALKLANNVFTREVLIRLHGDLASSFIASC